MHATSADRVNWEKHPEDTFFSPDGYSRDDFRDPEVFWSEEDGCYWLLIAAREDELGKKLFTRQSFSIALTEEGVLLRDRAEDLVTMADKIEKEFLSLDDITGGELFFGLAESYQIRYLARELRVLKAQYPGLILNSF